MEADEYLRMADNQERHWWYRSTRALINDLLAADLADATTPLILDAAGGVGATGGWLAATAPTINLDMEPAALQLGARRHPGYLPVLADLNALPFAERSFSIVLCTTALYHRMVPHPAAVVADFARVLRPGGVLCWIEPAGKRLWRNHDEVTHGARRFALGEMRSISRDAGLTVERATGAYSFLVPPAALMTRFEQRSETSDVGRNQHGVFGMFGALARAERLLLRRTNLPLGLSGVVLARKPVV